MALALIYLWMITWLELILIVPTTFCFLFTTSLFLQRSVNNPAHLFFTTGTLFTILLNTFIMYKLRKIEVSNGLTRV